MGAEASVAVVAVGHKVEAEPIFVADDGRWDITARQPERETETERHSESFTSLQKKSPAAVFFYHAFAQLVFSPEEVQSVQQK